MEEIYSDNNFEIYKVNDYDAMRNNFGYQRTTWCVTRDKRFFEHYLHYNNLNKCFYVIHNKNTNDRCIKYYGFYIQSNNKIYCLDSVERVCNVQEILSTTNFNLNTLY